MKRLIHIFLILTSLQASAAGDPLLCDKALNSCTAEIAGLQDLLKITEQHDKLVTLQRDQAMKDLEKASQPALLPWWAWAILGGAAAAILIRH